MHHQKQGHNAKCIEGRGFIFRLKILPVYVPQLRIHYKKENDAKRAKDSRAMAQGE